VGYDCSDTDPDRRPAPTWGGASVGTIVDPFRGTVHTYESEPERAVLTVLISLPGVLGIREQRTVSYVLAGVHRRYTFDIVVEWRDGLREAIAVRQSDRGLHADDTVEVVKAICAQHGAKLADDFRAITYETLDPVAVLNGRQIIRCGRDHDYAAQSAVRGALRRLGPATTLREVAIASGHGQRGVRAAVALLQSGIIVSPPGERLRLDLPLENRVPGAGVREQ
jgi:hypothetical protein